MTFLNVVSVYLFIDRDNEKVKGVSVFVFFRESESADSDYSVEVTINENDLVSELIDVVHGLGYLVGVEEEEDRFFGFEGGGGRSAGRF